LSNRLWAKHVKPPSLWKRIPLAIKIILVLSLVIGGVYGAIQVISNENGLFHVVGTGFTVTLTTPTAFMNMNITDPLTEFVQLKQNVTWSILNTGKVSLSIRYFTSLPTNITLLMLSNNVNFQGQGIAPGATATGWFNTTVGHFNNVGDIAFTLTIEGCYPVGLC